MVKKPAFKKNKEEIIYNLINSALAGALVFLGSLSSGELSWRGIILAIIATLSVVIAKFKEYWEKEKEEYSAMTKLFNFVGG